MWRKLEQPARFIVLEQGAGRGDLAQGVRTWAAQEATAFNGALDYRTEDMLTGQDAVEGSPEDSERKKQTAQSTVETQSIPSVILSNELVDAFPVHIVETRGGRLYELFVDVQQGQLCEVLAEPSTEAVASYLDRYKIPWLRFDDGWRAEVNLDALHWMERV